MESVVPSIRGLVPVCSLYTLRLVQRFRLRPVFFHLRAFNAKLARLRVVGFLLFFIARSLLTGMFFPFLAPAALRNLPLLLGLILIGARRRLAIASPALLRATDLVEVVPTRPCGSLDGICPPLLTSRSGRHGTSYEVSSMRGLLLSNPCVPVPGGSWKAMCG